MVNYFLRKNSSQLQSAIIKKRENPLDIYFLESVKSEVKRLSENSQNNEKLV